jgi:hypothetical protein
MALTNYTTWVKEYKDGNFDVKIGYFPEDIYVGDCFDDSIDPDTGKPYYDTDEMARKIDMGYLDWFVARVQYLYDGIEMGSAYLGGNLYDDADKAIEEGLSGYLEDMIDEARDEAQGRALEMVERLKKDFLEMA